MADLSTYQKAADSIYDPQLQAELIANDQKKASSLYNINEETKSVEPEYQKALKGITDQTRENEGKINMLYSQRLGGQFSGLQGNDMGMMYSKAADNRTEIETARASKLSSIASRRTLAENDAATSANVLRSKYTGMKNQYAQNAYQDALKADEDTRRWNAEMAVKKSSSAAAAKPTPQQAVEQAFYGYEKGNSNYQGHAENVIRALMSEYGMSEKDAGNIVYPYRKAKFGN